MLRETEEPIHEEEPVTDYMALIKPPKPQPEKRSKTVRKRKSVAVDIPNDYDQQKPQK